jgi:hypothetical protein
MDRLWLTKALRKFIFYYVRPHDYRPVTGPNSQTGVFVKYRHTLFETTLKSLISAARSSGAQVVVMTLPFVVSRDMTEDDLRRSNVIFPYFQSAYAVGDFVDLIAAYNSAIRRTARSEDVAVVDLATEIDSRQDRRDLFFDTMHPNERGTRLVAEILARELRNQGVIGQ